MFKLVKHAGSAARVSAQNRNGLLTCTQAGSVLAALFMPHASFASRQKTPKHKQGTKTSPSSLEQMAHALGKPTKSTQEKQSRAQARTEPSAAHKGQNKQLRQDLSKTVMPANEPEEDLEALASLLGEEEDEDSVRIANAITARVLQTQESKREQALAEESNNFRLRVAPEDALYEKEKKAALAASAALDDGSEEPDEGDTSEEQGADSPPTTNLDENEFDEHVPEEGADEFVAEVVTEHLQEGAVTIDSAAHTQGSDTCGMHEASKSEPIGAQQLLTKIGMEKKQGLHRWREATIKKSVDLRERCTAYLQALRGLVIRSDPKSTMSAYSTAKAIVRELSEFQQYLDERIKLYNTVVQQIPLAFKSLVEEDPLCGASLSGKIIESDATKSTERLRRIANELLQLGVSPRNSGRFVYFSSAEWNLIARALINNHGVQDIDDLAVHLVTENTFHIPLSESLSILAHIALSLARGTTTKRLGVSSASARASINILLRMFPGDSQPLSEPLCEAVGQRLAAGGQYVFALELLDLYLSKGAKPRPPGTKEDTLPPLIFTSSSLLDSRVPANWPFGAMLDGCAEACAVDESFALFRAARAQAILPLDRHAFLQCISPVDSTAGSRPLRAMLVPPHEVLQRMVYLRDSTKQMTAEERKALVRSIPAEIFFSHRARRAFLESPQGQFVSTHVMLPPIREVPISYFESLLTVLAAAGRADDALEVLQIVLDHSDSVLNDPASPNYQPPVYLPLPTEVSLTSVSSTLEHKSLHTEANTSSSALITTGTVPLVTERCFALAIEACTRAERYTDAMRILTAAELGLTRLPDGLRDYQAASHLGSPEAHGADKQLDRAKAAFAQSLEGKALKLARAYINLLPGAALFKPYSDLQTSSVDPLESLCPVHVADIEASQTDQQTFTANGKVYVRTGAFYETPRPAYRKSFGGEEIPIQLVYDALKFVGARMDHAPVLHAYVQPAALHIDPFIQELAPTISNSNIVVVATSKPKGGAGVITDSNPVPASTLAAMGIFKERGLDDDGPENQDQDDFAALDQNDESQIDIDSEKSRMIEASAQQASGQGNGAPSVHPPPSTPSPNAPLYKLVPLTRGPLTISLSMQGQYYALKAAAELGLVPVAALLLDRIKKQYELNRIAIARLQAGLPAVAPSLETLHQKPAQVGEARQTWNGSRISQVQAERLSRSLAEPRQSRAKLPGEVPVLPPLIFVRPVIPMKDDTKDANDAILGVHSSQAVPNPIYAIPDRTEVSLVRVSPIAVRLAHCQAIGRPIVENIRVWELVERRPWPPVRPNLPDTGKESLSRDSQEYASDPVDIALVDLLACASISRAHRVRFESMLNYFAGALCTVAKLFEKHGRIEHVLAVTQLAALHLLPLVRASSTLSHMFPPYFVENVVALLYSGINSCALRDAPVATLGQLDQIDRALVLNPELALKVEYRLGASRRKPEFLPLTHITARAQRRRAQRYRNLKALAEKGSTSPFDSSDTDDAARKEQRLQEDALMKDQEPLCYPVGLPVPGGSTVLNPIPPPALWKLRREAYVSAMICFARLPAKHKLMSIATVARPEFGPELLTQMRVNGMLFSYAVDKAYGCVSVADALAAATSARDLIPSILRTPRHLGKGQSSAIEKYARYVARARTSNTLLSQHSSTKNVSPAAAALLSKIQREEANETWKQLMYQKLPDYLDFSHVHGMQPDIATYTAHLNLIASQGLGELHKLHPDLLTNASAMINDASKEVGQRLSSAMQNLGAQGTTLINKGKVVSKRAHPGRIWEQLMLSALPYRDTPYVEVAHQLMLQIIYPQLATGPESPGEDILDPAVWWKILTPLQMNKILDHLASNKESLKAKVPGILQDAKIRSDIAKAVKNRGATTTLVSQVGQELAEKLVQAMPLIDTYDEPAPAYLALPSAAEVQRWTNHSGLASALGADVEGELERRMQSRWNAHVHHPMISTFDETMGLLPPAQSPPILAVEVVEMNAIAKSERNQLLDPLEQKQTWMNALQMRFALMSEIIATIAPGLAPKRADLLPHPKTFDAYLAALVEFDASDRPIAVKRAVKQMRSSPFCYGLTSRSCYSLLLNAGKQRSALASIQAFRLFVQCLAAEVTSWEGNLAQAQREQFQSTFGSLSGSSAWLEARFGTSRMQLPSSSDTFPSDLECALLMYRLGDRAMPSHRFGEGVSISPREVSSVVQECLARCSVARRAPASRNSVASTVLLAAKSIAASQNRDSAEVTRSAAAMLPYLNRDDKTKNFFELPDFVPLEEMSHHLSTYSPVPMAQAVVGLAYALEQSGDVLALRKLVAWLSRLEKIHAHALQQIALESLIPLPALTLAQAFVPSHSMETLTRLTQLFYGPSFATRATITGPATSLAYRPRMMAYAPRTLKQHLILPASATIMEPSSRTTLTYERMPQSPRLVLVRPNRIRAGGPLVPTEVYASLISLIERMANADSTSRQLAKAAHALAERLFIQGITTGRLEWWQDTNSPGRAVHLNRRYLLLDLHTRLPLAALALRMCLNDLYELFKQFVVRPNGILRVGSAGAALPETTPNYPSGEEGPFLSLGVGNVVPATRSLEEQENPGDKADTRPTDNLFATMTSLVRKSKPDTPHDASNPTSISSSNVPVDLNAVVAELKSLYARALEEQQTLLPTTSTITQSKQATMRLLAGRNYLVASPEVALDYALLGGGLLLSVGSGTRSKPAMTRSLVWAALTKGLGGIVVPVEAGFFAPKQVHHQPGLKYNMGVIHISPEALLTWLEKRYVLEFGSLPRLSPQYLPQLERMDVAAAAAVSPSSVTPRIGQPIGSSKADSRPSVNPFDSMGSVQAGSLRLLLEARYALPQEMYIALLRDVLQARLASKVPVPQALLHAVTKQLSLTTADQHVQLLHSELKALLKQCQ